MNRIWQEVFGRGIVHTSEDFGTQGDRPTHPELLDWLASEFESRGWSMKQMVRLMVTSSTYRQSSNARPELDVARSGQHAAGAPVRACGLPAELIRDEALYAAGLLDLRIGGPSVKPPQPKGVAELSYARLREMGGKHRRRPLSPRPLHPFPAHHAVSAAHEFRRAQRRASPARAASAPIRRCRR